MEWSYLVLGAVSIVEAGLRGVLVEYRSRLTRFAFPGHRFWVIPDGDTFIVEETEHPANLGHRQPLPVPRPFERTALGKKARLAWPNGATSIGEYDFLTGWSDRYAVVRDDRGFSVIDAESDRVARLMLPPDTIAWDYNTPFASAGLLWIGGDDGIYVIPLAALEELTSGSVEISFVPHYPRRRRDHSLACVFLWYLQDGHAMVEPGDGKGGANEPKLRVALPRLALAKYAPITLVDELHPWHFAACDIPDHGRVAITNTDARTPTAKITSTRGKDPTGVAKAPASALPTRVSSEQLDRLVDAVIANPTDDAQRAVLADLLLELGDPSAEAIAKLRAEGKLSPAKLKEALGPLGPYLIKVELEGGFPIEASINHNAPNERDHAGELDAACADFRIRMIHTLHAPSVRRAAVEIFARLIKAATALRRVDVSNEAWIDALIAADRRVEYLEHVDFAKAAWMAKLATATFDSVTHVHTVVGLAHLQPLVNRLLKDASKFFKRARRTLVLDETMKRYPELVQALGPHWPKLPLASISMPGVTIRRDGITGDDDQLVAVARRAFG